MDDDDHKDDGRNLQEAKKYRSKHPYKRNALSSMRYIIVHCAHKALKMYYYHPLFFSSSQVIAIKKSVADVERSTNEEGR